MKTKHRQYLQSASELPSKKQSKQQDRSLLDEKENMSNCNADKNQSAKFHWQDSSSSELDYLKMIREKEETIRELTSMLEMMNDSLVDERKLKELTKTMQEYQQKIMDYQDEIKQLSNQTRVLTIENQCLIRVIEKNQISQDSQREEILRRQISELKESLQNAEKQLSQTRNNSESASERLLKAEGSMKELSEQNQSLTDLNKELEMQCEKLIQILKEKEEYQTKKMPPRSGGQKITLLKIRDQYKENINLTKEYFYQESERILEQYQKIITSVQFKLDTCTRKIQQLEQKKAKPAAKPSEVKERQASFEIQYLMQKYYQTEKDLEEQKSVNSRLSNELEMAQKTLRELSLMEGSEFFDISSSLKKGQFGEELLKFNEEITRFKELQKQNTVLKETVEDLQSKIEHEKITSTMKMETVMNCYENQLHDKISFLTSQIQTLKTEKAALTEKNNSLSLRVKELENELLGNAQYKQKLMEQNKALGQKLNKMLKDKEIELEQMKEIIATNEKKREQMTQIFNSKIIELQSELSSKGSTTISLEEQLRTKEMELQKQISFNSQLIQSLNPSIEAELIALKKATLDINQMNNNEQTYYDIAKTNDSELQMKMEQNLKITQQLNELREDISSKQQHNISLESHIDTLQHQIQALRYQVKQKTLETTHLQKQKHLIELAHAKPTSLNFQMFVNIVDKLLSIQMKSKAKKKQAEVAK